ncbi:MAG: N,N-dimethylformamidase beta subunit family domain-containing protein, partial [Planctomycetaceae bacterium]
AVPAARNLIRGENEKPGTTDWLLANTRVEPETQYRCPWIEGYCSRTSVKAGETIEFKVSTDPASKFTIDLYRMGHYGGKGGRLVEQFGPLQGSPQPDPSVGEVRLRECAWETALELKVPDDWPSGVYLAKLTEQREKLQSYMVFIVRDDRPCDFLFQCSDTTWAAYNRWPDLWSLYDDGTPPHNWYTGPGVAVSFDRPYGKYRQILDAPLSQGSGEFLLWEFPLCYWMEQHGYDVSYISNLDTHADPKTLLRGRVFLSVAHDEYWSLDMYQSAKRAIEGGVHAAFFSGNAVDGVIDIRPNAAGVPGRTIERVGKFGGVDSERERQYEQKWTQHGPDPALLMGARTTTPANGTADWTCTHPSHWLFDGTGMKNGESIPGLVGWEHHGPPLPEIHGLEVLARGPVFSRGRPQNTEYTATIYPGPKGNLVFNAATIWWSDGLSAPPGYIRPSAHGGTPPGPDERVQRITTNLFRRFLA